MRKLMVHSLKSFVTISKEIRTLILRINSKNCIN